MRLFPILGIALMTLLICSSHSALASKWVLFSGFYKKDPQRSYIDFDSVRALPDNQVFVWLKFENAIPINGLKKALLAEKFDCKNQATSNNIILILYKVGQEQPVTLKGDYVRSVKPASALQYGLQLACVARQRKANRPPARPH